MTIVSSIANFHPLLGLCVGLPLGIYSIVLAIIAINAVHRFGYLKAAIAYFAPVVVIVGVIFLCFLLILTPLVIGG